MRFIMIDLDGCNFVGNVANGCWRQMFLTISAIVVKRYLTAI